MEFWEGAILVVGGLLLVGHMSRYHPSHPLYSGDGSVGGDGTPLPTGGCSGCGSSATSAIPRPLTKVRFPSAPIAMPSQGPTRITNTDGSNAIIAGESLAAPATHFGAGLHPVTLSQVSSFKGPLGDMVLR